MKKINTAIYMKEMNMGWKVMIFQICKICYQDRKNGLKDINKIRHFKIKFYNLQNILNNLIN